MLYNQDWDKTQNNPVSAVLLKAADLIERHGHIKYVRRTDKGMCLLGALQEAQGIDQLGYSHATDTSLTYAAAKAIVDTLGLPEIYGARSDAVTWNNAPQRTAQEVIDGMRQAAKAVAKSMVTA